MAITAAMVVFSAGMIGFVGLIVPHIVRILCFLVNYRLEKIFSISSWGSTRANLT